MTTLASLPQIETLALLFMLHWVKGSSTVNLGIMAHTGVTLTWPGYWNSFSFGLN